MSSSVHFRFKSAREFETLSFEGDFLKVADLKVAIVERKKLNFGEGFDLEISDASTGDLYADENALVQKNTSVIVRRIPGLKQGGILSLQEMAGKNERYAEKQAAKPQQQNSAPTSQSHPLPKTIEGSDEAERIASLVMQSHLQYDQFPPSGKGRYQNRSSHRGRGGNASSSRNSQGQSAFPNVAHPATKYPDRAPRPSSNYVCHRCNRPGHWIDQCPTNGDPTYDRIKVRAPTGIPRSMLRQVDAPESGTGLQDSSGHFVTLQPNEEEFARQTVGLRLSQAAAAAVDKVAEANDPEKREIDPTSAIVTDSSDPKSQQITQSDQCRGAERNATQNSAKQSHKVKPNAIAGEHGGLEKASRKDDVKPSASHERMSERPSPPQEKRKGDNGAKRHEPGAPTQHNTRQTQLPPAVGIPNIPMPPNMPPGFPPLGMPPIPGMPPLPPHILMAMAMANGQTGRPHQLPHGMVPTLPTPFANAMTRSDQKKQGVTAGRTMEGHNEETIDSKPSSEAHVIGENLNGGSDPSFNNSKHRHSSWKNDVDHRQEEQCDQQDVDPSQKIDSAFNPKPDSHVSEALRLNRDENRTHRQRFVSENEYGSNGETRHGREPASLSRRDRREPVSSSRSYHRKAIRSRSRSPSRRARKSAEESKGSPRRRGRRHEGDAEIRLSSPGRRGFERERDRMKQSHRGEELAPEYSLAGYREDIVRGEVTRGRRQGSLRRGSPSLSPIRRRIPNGAAYPDVRRSRSRSPRIRQRQSSPRHHLPGDSRDRRRVESPRRRDRRDSSKEIGFRSRTPPGNSRYGSRSEEDSYARRTYFKKSRRSPSEESRRDPAPGASTDTKTHHNASAEGIRSTVPRLSEQKGDKPRGLEVVRTQGEKGRKEYMNAADKLSEEGAEGDQSHRRARGEIRRKRELDKWTDSEKGNLKRQRREYREEVESAYRRDMRDRPSVHDRLGRHVERRRRRGQRKSVHDRLG